MRLQLRKVKRHQSIRLQLRVKHHLTNQRKRLKKLKKKPHLLQLARHLRLHPRVIVLNRLLHVASHATLPELITLHMIKIRTAKLFRLDCLMPLTSHRGTLRVNSKNLF
jgi:hypothetical protein